MSTKDIQLLRSPCPNSVPNTENLLLASVPNTYKKGKVFGSPTFFSWLPSIKFNEPSPTQNNNHKSELLLSYRNVKKTTYIMVFLWHKNNRGPARWLQEYLLCVPGSLRLIPALNHRKRNDFHKLTSVFYMHSIMYRHLHSQVYHTGKTDSHILLIIIMIIIINFNVIYLA